MLPLLGFTYGDMDYEGQKLTVTLGKLICQPNMELEEKLSIENQLSVLDKKLISTDDLLVNHTEFLEGLKVIKTK